MKKMLIFTLYNKNGASSNYRILMYLEELSKKYQVEFSYFWNDSYTTKYINDKKKYFIQISFQYLLNFIKRFFHIIFIAKNYDYIFFQKNIIPACPVTFIKYLHKNGCKIIFDVDDAIYLSRKDYSKKIAKDVDVVITGNDNLLNYYKKINRNTVMIPTVDFTPMYKPYLMNTFEKKIIGWIGSNATIKNLDLIINPLNRIIEKHPEVEFWFISSNENDYTSKIKNSKFIKWNINDYIKDMSCFTIGIMPLFDNDVNRNKCGFKLIQYLNLVKPVIASDVGINKKIVGNCGVIAHTDDEWFDGIEKLLFNREEYTNFQNHIIDEFFENYSYEKNVKKIISVIDKMESNDGK